MSNLAKKVIVKSRDRFFAKLAESVAELDLKLIEVKHELLLNDEKQSKRFYELNESIKNSGTIQVSKNELIAKLFSGLKVYLDTRDISVMPHLALDGIWEHNITRAWLSVVKSDNTILDIGANYGYFGALAAQKTDKENSKVIFFEPNPGLIPYINKTLSVNWLNEQCLVENVAVSDRSGKAKLSVLKDYIGSSSLHTVDRIDSYMHNKMKVEAESVITVPTISVDEYCAKHKISTVDLIKMDIEGYEDKAYAGMRKVIQASPSPTLFIEFTRESYDNPKQFYQDMLGDFGYVYLIDQQGNLILQNKTDYDAVIGNPHDWIMPVFSKSNKLAGDKDCDFQPVRSPKTAQAKAD